MSGQPRLWTAIWARVRCKAHVLSRVLRVPWERHRELIAWRDGEVVSWVSCECGRVFHDDYLESDSFAGRAEHQGLTVARRPSRHAKGDGE